MPIKKVSKVKRYLKKNLKIGKLVDSKLFESIEAHPGRYQKALWGTAALGGGIVYTRARKKKRKKGR